MSSIISASAVLATKGLVITAFHKDAFAIMSTGHNAVTKAEGTMQTKLQALIKSKHGAVCMSFAEFKNYRAGLKELAVQKGLADDQWLRKPFNAAIIALYGALPEAQTAAAIAKRKLRDAAGTAKPKAGKTKGETAPRRTGTPETLEQYIARVGIWKVLEACTTILGADASTADQAKLLAQLKAS